MSDECLVHVIQMQERMDEHGKFLRETSRLFKTYEGESVEALASGSLEKMMGGFSRFMFTQLPAISTRFTDGQKSANQVVESAVAAIECTMNEAKPTITATPVAPVHLDWLDEVMANLDEPPEPTLERAELSIFCTEPFAAYVPDDVLTECEGVRPRVDRDLQAAGVGAQKVAITTVDCAGQPRSCRSARAWSMAISAAKTRRRLPMATPILDLVSPANIAHEVWRRRAAAAEAAPLEAADQIIVDRERLDEAVRQTQEKMRRRNLAMIAAIRMADTLPMPAGMSALLGAQDARPTHRASQNRWLSVPPDDLCTRAGR